jgi:hypothetical protein
VDAAGEADELTREQKLHWAIMYAAMKFCPGRAMRAIEFWCGVSPGYRFPRGTEFQYAVPLLSKAVIADIHEGWQLINASS